MSGDVNPNPGSNGIEQHDSTEQQRSTRLLTFYANARGIVNKSSKLDITIAALGLGKFFLTEIHLDSSIPDGEIFLGTTQFLDGTESSMDAMEAGY